MLGHSKEAVALLSQEGSSLGTELTGTSPWITQPPELWEINLRYLSEVKVTQSCSSLWDPNGLYNPWNSPGQNTEVGSLSLLQGIFPTQGLNPGLRHCRQILYQLSHKGSPLNHLVYGVLLRQPNQTRRMFIGKQLWLGSESQDMLQNEERVPLNDP